MSAQLQLNGTWHSTYLHHSMLNSAVSTVCLIHSKYVNNLQVKNESENSSIGGNFVASQIVCIIDQLINLRYYCIWKMF